MPRNMSFQEVDRTDEHLKDPCIKVTLRSGHVERFFIPGLSDEEYLARAKEIEAMGRLRQI